VKTLLLWDIDGTLTHSTGAGERALRTALRDAHGIDDDLSWLQLSGRTDVWIGRQMLEHHHLRAHDEDVRHLLSFYLKALPAELNNPKAHVLPGIREALTAIAGMRDVTQGLLTGNLAKGADIKLGHFGIRHFFAFGAFADDSAHRNDLGPFAIKRAAAHHGMPFDKTRVVIIGDTPHDIACGQAIHALTFGVATGKFTEQQLLEAGADVTFPNFADTPRFLAEVEKAVHPSR
jgi:phosphoglycolate phosphatase-like HAD superfamily hydrolase